jgi:transcriptional regulator NrdR family protein
MSEPAGTVRTSGVRCPECRQKMATIRSRTRADGRIVRRRKCAVCGVRVTTEERPVGPYLTPRQM